MTSKVDEIHFAFVAQRGGDVLGGIRAEVVFRSIQDMLLEEGVSEEHVMRIADRLELLQSRANRRALDA